MKERLMTWVLGALALGTGCSNVGPAWTYAGAEGPASWGTLDPTFAACGSGRSQSPVNIVEVLPRDLPNLAFKYGTAPVRLRNNGRAIEQAFDPGQSVAIGNMRYELQSLTLHTPSEHRAAGRTFPIELQLLHKSAQGHLLVISVMVKEGIITAAALAGILNHLPPQPGTPMTASGPYPWSSFFLPNVLTCATAGRSPRPPAGRTSCGWS